MSKNEMLAKLELLNKWEKIIEEAKALDIEVISESERALLLADWGGRNG